MRPMPLRQLAEVVGADPSALDAERQIGPNVCIDSRLASSGALFVAFPGDHVDGHDYIQAAADRGAAATLCTHIPEGLTAEARAGCLVVDDSTAALGRLARHVVDSLSTLRVIAVTGSQGKTSTKDLLAQVLEAAAPTVAPEGSFNNEIGVPLTATKSDERTAYLVSEMGARGRGHIAYLCQLTPPTVGIELNVGQAHLGEFGSQEAIAEAKGELVESLPRTGWAVLNADDPRVLAMSDRTPAQVALFSLEGRPEAQAKVRVWAEHIRPGELDRYDFTLACEAAGSIERQPVRLQLVGRHQVANALAAAAAAFVSGMDPAVIGPALSTAGERSRWRMEVTVRSDMVTVVNDAYNANPDSMRAAMDTLASMGQVKRKNFPNLRTRAVLGQMRELGAASASEHERVGRAVGALEIDELLALGENAPDMVRGARAAGCKNAREVGSINEAIELLESELGAGDIVLVKASRALALEKVAEALVAENAAGLRPVQK